MRAVGIIETGNSMGLTEEELRELPSTEKEKRKKVIREQFIQIGADYVIDSIAELESIIDDINQRLVDHA
jgi:phosphonoacetaldehyde hydrolase